MISMIDIIINSLIIKNFKYFFFHDENGRETNIIKILLLHD